ARAFESVALLIAPLFVARAVPLAGTLLGSGAVFGALAAAIFSGRFPACFVDGQGLTGFKIGSEYMIVLTLAGALLLLARRRGCFEPPVFRALALSIVFKIGTEVSFTLYTDVYGFSNLIGHLLKLVSIALIYRALVETAIARPFELLFRELKHSEAALQAENIELAQAQEALRRKNEELAALIAEKNELLGIAAHDIRSPLAAIGMYATLLSRTLAARGDAEGLRLLAVIRRTNDRAFAMVSNVLDMTAIESGRLRLEARSHDLRRLVEEILEVQRSLAQGKGIEIDFECEEVAPACVDPARFEQVLSNLLSNALKFSPAGTRVTVRLFGRDGRAAVSVHDQGIGIAPESLGRIFLPFATAAAEGTAGERSTGLGLAIVKKIVESHGGRIEVDSAVGGGSTFTALFPLAPPETGVADGASGRDERM
ncbi:MAG TPA: MASE3 domain-containing protein, partial [bacterium]